MDILILWSGLGIGQKIVIDECRLLYWFWFIIIIGIVGLFFSREVFRCSNTDLKRLTNFLKIL